MGLRRRVLAGAVMVRVCGSCDVGIARDDGGAGPDMQEPPGSRQSAGVRVPVSPQVRLDLCRRFSFIIATERLVDQVMVISGQMSLLIRNNRFLDAALNPNELAIFKIYVLYTRRF